MRLLSQYLVWSLAVIFRSIPQVSCDIISDVSGTIIDLSHTYDSAMPLWGDHKFYQNIIVRGNHYGFWMEFNVINTTEHSGTHMDAPAHMMKGKERVDDVSLERLVGNGVRMDFSQQAAANNEYQVPVADIMSWESTHGPLPPKCIILLDFGWTHKWPDRNAVFGSTTPSNTSTYHFPGLHPDAGKWIASQRPQVMAVGVDTMSVDYGQSDNYLAHRYLFNKSVSVFENVANSHKVPVTGSTIFAIPMKIGDGSGAPARIFAVVPRSTCGVGEVRAAWVLVLSLALCALVNVRSVRG